MEISKLFLEIFEAYLIGDIAFHYKVDLIDLLDYAYAKYNEGHLFETVDDCYNEWLNNRY